MMPLTEQDYLDAAATLDVDVAAVKAVAEVESNGRGFLPDGRPTILYERHVFSRLTHHVHDLAHPTISSSIPGNYGAAGAHQWDRLTEAIALDHEAALKSASWGAYQIMGENYRQAGFDTVQAFVNAMYADEQHQLTAFVNFVRSQGLDVYLKAHNWASFALHYNGRNYRINKYDTKLANAYAKYSN